MIDGYPNFDWSPGNPITDGYKNEDDDKSEYKHSHGVKEELSHIRLPVDHGSHLHIVGILFLGPR